MQTLEDIRGKIDLVDNQLVALVKERLGLAEKIAEVKKNTGAAIYDPERERALLTRLSEMAGEDNEDEIRVLYATLLSLSKSRQRSLMSGTSVLSEEICAAIGSGAKFPSRGLVACHGAEGAYSQQAVSAMFDVPTILYFKSVDKVFDAVESGLCQFGVLPVENPTGGSVVSVFETIARRHFHIVKSLNMHIDHVLLGNSGARLSEIRCISSQPNALAQCAEFVGKLPNCEILYATNTALAAKTLSESGRLDMAVISSRECAQLYGLDILAENIAGHSSNYTRFVCISKQMEIYDNARKISLMLALQNTPHAISILLDKFSALDLEVTKLESRLSMDGTGRNILMLDFMASVREPKILHLLDDLASDPQIVQFSLLGVYGEQ